MPRWIAHLDMDCFFVSVERLLDPSLVGKPVVVGGDPNGRGVVASASYEARRFGVRSAMASRRAKELCPQLIFAPGHHHLYGEYHDKVREILARYAPGIEAASIDEFYLDFSGCNLIYDGIFPLLRRIRARSPPSSASRRRRASRRTSCWRRSARAWPSPRASCGSPRARRPRSSRRCRCARSPGSDRSPARRSSGSA